MKKYIEIVSKFIQGVRLSSFHRANNISFPLAQMKKKRYNKTFQIKSNFIKIKENTDKNKLKLLISFVVFAQKNF
jgi:hypothetical protein